MHYQALTPIHHGRFSLNQTLPATVLDTILQRDGTVESYVLFTGYQPARLRGEMRAFEALPAPR